MNTYYSLGNGKRLEIFMWDDFFENDIWRGTADVVILDGPIYGGERSKEFKKTLFKDENGIYILWDDDKIYLNDFDYDSVEVMASRLAECVEKNDRWLVSDDEIIATLIKDTENVGLVADMPVFDMVAASLGFGFLGEHEQTVLCVPTERQYSKHSWKYKFTLECECESLRKYIPSRHVYASDFCDMLKEGHAKLVVKNEFKARLDKYIKMKEAEQKGKFFKVKKFFGMVEEMKNPYTEVLMEG